MEEHVYVFYGRVIPERALISISEIPFSILQTDDVPTGTLYIEVVLSQIAGRFIADTEVRNIFTLRNLVEDAAREILDVAGYCNGYGYDVEIVQMVRPNTPEKQVFGIDVPVLKGVVEAAGIQITDLLRLLARPDGHFLRHALADAREAIKSPRDTGFFCYRAIESLKNACATRNAIHDLAKGWEAFRTEYLVDREDIMEVKRSADAVRHADLRRVSSLSDQDRASLFTKTWRIINAYIVKERKR